MAPSAQRCPSERAEVLRAAKIPDDFIQNVTLYKGEGCDQCGGTGYKGRQGLYEVMLITSKIRNLIMAESGTDALVEQALSEGMLTLRMDGLKKLERGITTLEEVLKETAAAN